MAKGGSKLNRSRTVTVRMTEKDRERAELFGRVQYRSLSSFIEFAVVHYMKHNKAELEPRNILADIDALKRKCGMEDE